MATRDSIKNKVGLVFGSWTVISYAGKRGRRPFWNCCCDCGTLREVCGWQLRPGNPTASCGCRRNADTVERFTKHGHSSRRSYSLTYRSWQGMIGRCTDAQHESFADYGGRGISVCERWRDFAHFLADMGERPGKHHTIEREDSNGDYCQTNCVWATYAEQRRNRRGDHLLTLVTHDGRTQCIEDWSKELGIPRWTLRYRITIKGLTLQQVINTPKGKHFKG